MTQIYKVVNGNCPTINELVISISKYEFNIRNFQVLSIDLRKQ